jgi:hypothetical protein
MVNYIPSAVILCTRVAGPIEMRGREKARSPAGAIGGFGGDAMVVLEERLGEEMMKKKLKVPYILERGRRRRRGRRCVIKPPAGEVSRCVVVNYRSDE